MKRLKTDLLLLPTKLIEKTPDLRNAKEHYVINIRKKKSKISKAIRNNYSATKNI